MILEINFNQSNKTERVEINKSTCIIGRSPKSDCQIDMECFSRSHIEIEWDGKDFFITDLNSTNGVYINSEKIPVATKTLFKNFFPLEVGGAVSISIFSDEVATEDVEKPIIRNTSSSNTTTSIAMSSGLRKDAFKKKSIEKTSQSKIYLLAPVVIGIAAFYFYYNYSNEGQVVNTIATVQSAKEISTAPSLNKTDSELKSLISNDRCQELKELCQNLKLTHPQEKLTITDSELILYVNYPAVLVEMKSAFLPNEAMEKQAEYVLATYAYNPKVVSEALARNISYVVVAGIDPLDDLIRIKFSVVLNVKDAPKFSSEDHLSFFSNIFHGGIYRPYKKFLRPYLKVTNY
jgi:hypothetical protein